MTEGSGSYEAILDGLRRELGVLELRLGASEKLIELSRDPRNIEAAPILFEVIAESVLDAVVLRLRAIHEAGKRSLPKLISVAKHHRTRINWTDAPSLAQLEDQERAIDSHTEVLARMKRLRDKAIAHHDKAYVDRGHDFRTEVGLGTDEVVDLFRTTQRIVGTHDQWRNGRAPVSVGGLASAHVEIMVQRLRDTLVRGGATIGDD